MNKEQFLNFFEKVKYKKIQYRSWSKDYYFFINNYSIIRDIYLVSGTTSYNSKEHVIIEITDINDWITLDKENNNKHEEELPSSINKEQIMDTNTLLLFMMMSGKKDDNMSKMLPLLLLNKGGSLGGKLNMEKMMLLKMLPDLNDNERQSISEGNIEAALTSYYSRSENNDLLPFLLSGK